MDQLKENQKGMRVSGFREGLESRSPEGFEIR
jgi:hypothetical protein